MEDEKMEYAKEIEKLDKGLETWKPGIGVHKVVIIDEPIEDKYIDKQTKEETPQIKINIEVNGKSYIWYVTVGKTSQSLYGQLMYIGQNKKKLAGQTISVVVNKAKNRDGRERNAYSILEAIEIMKESHN